MANNKQQFYQELLSELKALIAGEYNLIATLANTSALLYQQLESVNWVGFYLLDTESENKEELILGPFQGKIACVRIPVGKGVCGTAVALNSVQRIADVHAFAGHIACDSESNAEIVLPLSVGNKVIGVLDIDSTQYNRFDKDDEFGLSAIIKTLSQHLRL